MDGQTYLDLLGARYSVRSFSDEPVTEEELACVLKAAQLSPSAKNMQPVRLCVVRDPENLAKVDECTRCRYGAPVAIIGAYDTAVSCKGLGYEHDDFGDIDTSIAIANMANAAAAAGLGSCWVGAYNAPALRERFNVPEGYVLVDMLMVGHPAADAAPAPRHAATISLDEMVVGESF